MCKTIKDGTYVINLDEYADIGTHRIALFCNKNDVIYFDSFGVEHILEEIKEFVGNKKIKENIFRVLEYKQTIQLCVVTSVFDSLVLC